jgi:prevent-host-death family protein
VESLDIAPNAPKFDARVYLDAIGEAMAELSRSGDDRFILVQNLFSDGEPAIDDFNRVPKRRSAKAPGARAPVKSRGREPSREITMKIITAAAAKNDFDEFLNMARREPIVVTKNNRPVGVFLSMEDIEDTILGKRALEAHAEGYLSADESEKLLDDLLNAPD